MPNEDFYWLLQFWAGTWLVCVPLAGSQRCSARVHNILFNLLTIKQQRVSLLGFPFFSQTLVTLDKSLFSFGLSNRRISAVFSCFDQSLILPVRPYKEARLYYFYLISWQNNKGLANFRRSKNWAVWGGFALWTHAVRQERLPLLAENCFLDIAFSFLFVTQLLSTEICKETVLL